MKLTTLTLAAYFAALASPIVAYAQHDAAVEVTDAAPSPAPDPGSAGVPAPDASPYRLDGTAGPPPDQGAHSPPETNAPDAEPDPVSLGQEIFRRIRSGEWLPALAAALVLLVWAVRRFAGKLSPWFKSKLGGYAISFATSLALTFSAALTAGEPITLGLVTMSLGAAWAAAGGYETLRDALGSKE